MGQEAWDEIHELLEQIIAEQPFALEPNQTEQFRQAVQQWVDGLDHSQGCAVPVLHLVRGLETYRQASRGPLMDLLHHTELTIVTGKAEPAWLLNLKQGRAESESRLAAALERLQALLAALAPVEVKKGKTEPDPSALDPATGLQTALQAEMAIREAIVSRRTIFLAAIWVERTQLTAARFGRSVVDQVLQVCSQQIATRLLQPQDSLFRWRGAGLVALLDRQDQSAAVASEVQRVLGTPINQYFELSFRTVYLPIKMVGETIALHGRDYEDVMEEVRRFYSVRQ